MYKGKKILALIPARGGSKGLSRKNIKLLLGKPLIAWTIEQAKSSSYIDYVYVSTEDEEIANISRTYGADIPFMRPSALAQDTSSSIDVVLYSVDKLREQYGEFNLVVLLEPTSPLRDSADIDSAIERLINNKKASSIVGISKAESFHPNFIVKVSNDDLLSPYTSDGKCNSRRQDLEELFFFEGSVYVSYIDSLIKNRSFYHKDTMGYIVPKWKSYEIDELSDFIIVEALMKAKNNKELQ
jgi:CMP-N,N'-diacetyllegionaminic acid synthase